MLRGSSDELHALLPVADLADRRRNDPVAYRARREARHHTIEVVGRLEPEMIVDDPVHLLMRHSHCRSHPKL